MKKVILSCLKLTLSVCVRLVFGVRIVGVLDWGKRKFSCVRVGENLKRGWNRKDGRYKIFKKGGKLGQEVGASKRMGWNTLTNYA